MAREHVNAQTLVVTPGKGGGYWVAFAAFPSRELFIQPSSLLGWELMDVIEGIVADPIKEGHYHPMFEDALTEASDVLTAALREEGWLEDDRR
jgi:hypothetical protein